SVRHFGVAQMCWPGGCLALACRPADVQPRHVLHLQGAHSHAKTPQCAIDLSWGATFLQKEIGLARIVAHHTVADEAVTYANQHWDLANSLRETEYRSDDRVVSPCAFHHFQQTHDVGRAEEVRAQHLPRTPRDGSDFINIQPRGIGCQDGVLFAGLVQPREDVFLDLHVLEGSFDHQIDV